MGRNFALNPSVPDPGQGIDGWIEVVECDEQTVDTKMEERLTGGEIHRFRLESLPIAAVAGIEQGGWHQRDE